MPRFTASLSVACTIVVGVAGCATAVTPGDATMASSASSLAASSPAVTNTLPGPHPPPTDNNDGTSFDPCLAYTADELKGWGVAPGSVEDIANSPALQRGCKWTGDGWVLQQTVLNRSIDEYLNQALFPGSQQVMIGGLAGVTYRDPPDDMTVCYVELPSQKASVGTIIRMNSLQAQRAVPDACTKAVAIAADTAKKLPK